MTIMTSLAVLGALLPPAAADPCTALPAERVAAVFAAAGEPVTGDETFGFGDARQQGYCRYAFTDRNGIGISLEVNVAQLSAGERFTSCQPDGVGELRMFDGFTPREYLDFGLRFHDAWMAHKGRPTGTAPDPTMLATVRAGGSMLDGLVDSSWPGIVR